jgi:hypothetical protein
MDPPSSLGLRDERPAPNRVSYGIVVFVVYVKCGPTFCDSRANLYNAANMSGRKQNAKVMAMVKIKKLHF